MKVIAFSFILCFLSQNIVAQSPSTFFPEASGTIGEREKVSAIGFITPNKIDVFFNRLQQELNEPQLEEQFYTYRFRNKDWCDKEIIARLQSYTLINLDGSNEYSIFIFVEDKDGVDLLIPSTDSYKLITKYFEDLFNQVVKNGTPESFPKK